MLDANKHDLTTDTSGQEKKEKDLSISRILDKQALRQISITFLQYTTVDQNQPIHHRKLKGRFNNRYYAALKNRGRIHNIFGI